MALTDAGGVLGEAKIGAGGGAAGAGVGVGVGGTGREDLDDLLHKMHTLLHRQAQDHFLSRDDGTCFVNHESARELIENCNAQFEALQQAHAQQSETLRTALAGLTEEREELSGTYV